MSKGKVKTKLKDPLQGSAISRNFQNQIPNSFATRSKNPKAKPNWGKILRNLKKSQEILRNHKKSKEIIRKPKKS